MINRLHIALGILLLLSGCNLSKDHSGDIQANNGVLLTIEETEAAIASADTAALNALRSQRLRRLQYLDSILLTRPGSIDSSMAYALLNISTAGEPYHPVAVEYDVVRIRLRRAFEQLKAINHDLEHNLLPADSVEYILDLERLSAKMAVNEAQLLLLEADSANAKTRDWTARTDSLINELK